MRPELYLSASGLALKNQMPIRFVKRLVAQGKITPSIYYGDARQPGFDPATVQKVRELFANQNP